jgi:hypothetical protein
VGGSSCARIKQSCTSVRSGHSAQTACSMIAARGSGDRPGRARRSNGDNRSGASGQSLTSTSRRSDLREYVSDQPQDAEVGAWSRIFDGSGSPCLLAWSLLGVHVRRPVDVHHRRRGSRAPDYGYCQRLRQLLSGRVARASHTTSADASAEGKASVARIGPHSRRQYSSTNTIGESPTVVTTAGATFAEPTSPAPRGT